MTTAINLVAILHLYSDIPLQCSLMLCLCPRAAASLYLEHQGGIVDSNEQGEEGEDINESVELDVR